MVSEVSAIEVASTHGMVKIYAPNHVMLTAEGAAIRIQKGNITSRGPGKVEFKASMKELKGPASAEQSLELKKPGKLKLCDFRMHGGSAGGAGMIAVG